MKLKDMANVMQDNIHVVLGDWNMSADDIECAAKHIPAEYEMEEVRYIQVEDDIIYIHIVMGEENEDE